MGKAMQIMEAMQIERDCGFHVQAAGIGGYPRYTDSFPNPKFTKVIRLSYQANLWKDKQAREDLNKLDRYLDPYVKY